MKRTRIKIVGQSGSGLLSTGEIISQALMNLGFYLVSDREYPSLIKGGHSCFTINVSDEKIYSLSEGADIMLAIDKPSMVAYFDILKSGGVFVHGYERPMGIADIVTKAEERGIKVVHLPAREISFENGGNVLMQNMVLIGMLWKALGLPYEAIEEEITERFKEKPKLLEIDLKCAKAGYEQTDLHFAIAGVGKEKKILLEGNKAIALGAVHAGVRAYFAYPMSPASTILTYMSEMANKFGMVVKQAEDEITAAQMSLGAMFMGTRAFTATSGGGYDLMTETVSLAGIIENPLVIVVAQRPGPGTGLPTWTMQGDLNLAINAGHGEFPRIVMAVSEPEDCFSLIQHAFNFAEKYQSPVIVLTEKVVAESNLTVKPFLQNLIPIERGLSDGELSNEDRYKITEDGLSKRWLPGSSEAYYFANGDEHWEDGTLTEDGEKAGAMYSKRMRKLSLIKSTLPEPEIFGQQSGADISFIGWGSSKTVMLDIIEEYRLQGKAVNYLHYSYLHPFKEVLAKKFFEENSNVCLIEGNYTGQFGHIVECATDKKFARKLLKYDGRPFFIEDLKRFVDKFS